MSHSYGWGGLCAPPPESDGICTGQSLGGRRPPTLDMCRSGLLHVWPGLHYPPAFDPHPPWQAQYGVLWRHTGIFLIPVWLASPAPPPPLLAGCSVLYHRSALAAGADVVTPILRSRAGVSHDHRHRNQTIHCPSLPWLSWRRRISAPPYIVPATLRTHVSVLSHLAEPISLLLLSSIGP